MVVALDDHHDYHTELPLLADTLHNDLNHKQEASEGHDQA